MNGVYNIIKERGGKYVNGYKGREYRTNSKSGFYLVSANGALQELQNYCQTSSEFPVIAPSRDDAHAAPICKQIITARDYQDLVDNGCKIGYVIACTEGDKTEVKRHVSDEKLCVDYTEAATIAEKRGTSQRLIKGLIYICTPSSDGQGIVIEQGIFDLLCKIRLCERPVYLQIGASNDYGHVEVSQDVIDAYSKMKSQDEKDSFVQALQEGLDVQIKQCKVFKSICNYIYLNTDRLKAMAGISCTKYESTTHNVDERLERRKLEASPAIGKVGQMLQRFASSPVGVGIGIGTSIGLFGGALGASVKFGIDMVQHKDNTNTIVFGVSCGACILFGAVLLAMIIVKCKFSRPSEELEEPDPVGISLRSTDLTAH